MISNPDTPGKQETLLPARRPPRVMKSTGVFLLALSLIGCTQQEQAETKKQLRETGQEIKRDAQEAKREVQKGAKELSHEVNKDLKEAKREINGK